jgi:hypothetical protein
MRIIEAYAGSLRRATTRARRFSGLWRRTTCRNGASFEVRKTTAVPLRALSQDRRSRSSVAHAADRGRSGTALIAAFRRRGDRGVAQGGPGFATSSDRPTSGSSAVRADRCESPAAAVRAAPVARGEARGCEPQSRNPRAINARIGGVNCRAMRFSVWTYGPGAAHNSQHSGLPCEFPALAATCKRFLRLGKPFLPKILRSLSLMQTRCRFFPSHPK